MSQHVDAEIIDLMQLLAKEGGVMVSIEGEFSKAEDLGLVTTSISGAGWRDTETVTITNSGRRLLGMDAVTPEPSRRSIANRLKLFWTKRSEVWR